MPHPPFTEEWIQQFSDPYAVLGVSVSADDRRILKRFRTVAKWLHPDSHHLTDPKEKAIAGQVLAKLINPTYQRLKQEKGRTESLALLRFRVRRMTRDEPLAPTSETARRLLKTAVPEVEVFYEQSVAQLAEAQLSSLSQFEAVTKELAELNLVYLRLKMGEPMIREKRTGIVSAPESQPRQFTPTPQAYTQEKPPSYAEKHYLRAQEYLKKGNPQMAVQELRDALRIEADQARFHALLAKAYLAQRLPGAAKAYCRKALELDPTNQLAIACAKVLNIDASTPNQGKKASPSSSRDAKQSTASRPRTKTNGLFGGLFARKR